MLKLLHTADWQIGKLYGQFEPDDAALLAEARFAAVERLAQLASVQGVHMVLVAGDVFDAQGVAERTIHRLFNCLCGYAGPWVMIPGNHDAALSESVWTRAARLGAIPPNVSVCLAPGAVQFDALRVAVLAAPLTQRITHSDLTSAFAAIDTPAGFHRIGLAHGSVQGILADGIDSSNPIAAGRAAEARLDYLALGDWHGCRQIDARTWYSGTPETDRFRANDSGRALIVELASPGAEPVVTPVVTGQYRWFDESATLQVASDIDVLLARLATFGHADVVQITLDGETDLAGHARLRDALAQTQGRVRSLTVDLSALRIAPTEDDIDALAADGYLGDVIAELRALQGDSDGDRAGTAEAARDALVLLAGLLRDRRAASGNTS
ncbi:DNA repair exonuclease [Methyloversatilis sp.]|uniref:metallophosphoesterase family protein n=1 Tax=Methyloversatilis sp. TaxID=2569862 RepID=UPI00273606B2|nr:DNA repair exonuclease [Methyloversatilis sp.]MDP2870791.1 DNA repair exonuclease [Methyloversatilis sp.]MDP3456232.1 DNA repair exonuclease [Methyloversatilis sp.]MDP3577184.1 DNA repair exonuclease [Methyloversatilis sp.]